eukprot:jgi/Chlat1/4517/Chrsp29S04446
MAAAAAVVLVGGTTQPGWAAGHAVESSSRRIASAAGIVAGGRVESRSVKLRNAHNKRQPRERAHVSCSALKEEETNQWSRGRTTQKVELVLGPYLDKAITVRVDQAEVDKALKAKQDKKYNLVRVNFTGSGAKIGHTVKVSFKGVYAEGEKAGQEIPGTKANMYELDIQERTDEPWRSFVENIVQKGMGQEETKTFTMQFPSDFKAPALRNMKARFTLTVHEIAKKELVTADSRPLEEQRAALEAAFQTEAQRKSDEAALVEIRKVLLETSRADTDKVVKSVSWAKFGEKSLADFTWNLIQEEVAREQGLKMAEVPAFLISQADIQYL